MGPTFAGSRFMNADADVIAAGLLLELKTNLGNKRSDGTRRGDGPLRKRVVAAAAARADITFLGRQDHPGVRAAMRAAAALVVPSTWDEVCPMVVVESLANARPVLVTAKGGLPFPGRCRVDRPAGRVANPTTEALAATLGRAAREAGDLIGTARQRYDAVFSPSVVTDQLITIYKELAGSRR